MEAKIIRLIGSYAVLELSDQQEIKWPINKLPDGFKVGMIVWLKLDIAPSHGTFQSEAWKNLLNEILKEDSSVSK